MKPPTLLRLALAGTRTDAARVALTAFAALLATLSLLATATVLAIEGEAVQYTHNLLMESGLRPGVATALALLCIPVLALAGQSARARRAGPGPPPVRPPVGRRHPTPGFRGGGGGDRMRRGARRRAGRGRLLRRPGAATPPGRAGSTAAADRSDPGADGDRADRGRAAGARRARDGPAAAPRGGHPARSSAPAPHPRPSTLARTADPGRPRRGAVPGVGRPVLQPQWAGDPRRVGGPAAGGRSAADHRRGRVRHRVDLWRGRPGTAPVRPPPGDPTGGPPAAGGPVGRQPDLRRPARLRHRRGLRRRGPRMVRRHVRRRGGPRPVG